MSCRMTPANALNHREKRSRFRTTTQEVWHPISSQATPPMFLLFGWLLRLPSSFLSMKAWYYTTKLSLAVEPKRRFIFTVLRRVGMPSLHRRSALFAVSLFSLNKAWRAIWLPLSPLASHSIAPCFFPNRVRQKCRFEQCF